MAKLPTYDDLIRREARAWGNTQPDPANPQLWHDDRLFELFFGREYRWLIRAVVSAGPDVLELGCGEGSLALEIAKGGCTVTGVDLSDRRVARATERAEQSGLADRVRFSVADLNTADLPEKRFDALVAHDALHHILHIDRLLVQAKRALKPGGRILVMDYCGMGPVRRFLAAGLTAVLPTHQSYAEKWRSRTRLRSFLAGETAKRAAIEAGGSPALHAESPFEGISQSSLIRALHANFTTAQFMTFLPFWFYLAPKIRITDRLRPPIGRLFRTMDHGLSALGIRGAYFVYEGLAS